MTMNEQIQQLATRAGLYVDSNGRPYPQALSAEQADAALQKFAELIVRECIGVVEGGSFLHDQAPTAIFARECSGAIKRHFGVEE